MNATVPLQTVELEHLGRLYGAPTQTVQDRARQQPPPKIGDVFVGDLWHSSAILNLKDTSTLPEIITAYGSDIKMLRQRREEADAFMVRVLYCAMDRFHVETDKRKVEEGMLKKLLEPLGIVPQIALTAERCAMEAVDLVTWLKNEFSTEIDNIARRIATTLHYLADFNVVGLVDWKSPDICKFHYFTWGGVTHSGTVTQVRTGDIMAWNTLTTMSTETTRLERTRHTHHLVGAGMHVAGDYKRSMPERIKELIGHAPVWLKSHLVIIDGTETLSEQFTVNAGESVRQKVESVVRYDPALAFGPFVLAGWNESENPVPLPLWKRLIELSLKTPEVAGAFILLCVAWGLCSMASTIWSWVKPLFMKVLGE